MHDDFSPNPIDYVHVPIRTETYLAFVSHLDSTEHPARIVDQLLHDFWSERFLRRDSLGSQNTGQQTHEDLLVQERAWTAHYGDIEQGYRWDRLLLRNGTRLLSTYKGQEHFAEVRKGEIWFAGKSVTPSKFANAAAGDTIRNAWRDLRVKFPGQQWQEASALRHSPPPDENYRNLHLDAFASAIAEFNGSDATLNDGGQDD